jgi:polyisoprenoid-binding protein YceI
MHAIIKIIVTAMAVLLAACASKLPAPSSIKAAPTDFPAAYYQQARAKGMQVLEIDSAHSLVTIQVRRSGSLARLGHDHLVASHNVQGYIAPQINRADLFVPLTELTVDEAPLLAEAGFRSPAAQGVAEATRNNMLEKVLDVAHFPFSLIHVSRDSKDSADVKVTITLRGVAKNYAVPVKVEQQDGQLIVSGELSLLQTDFGITPLSVLNGALQVVDGLVLRFKIVADKSE